MPQTCVRWSVLTLGVALLVAAPALAAPVPADPPKAKGTTPQEIKKALDKKIDVDMEDQPLTLAVQQLKEQTGINFVVDKFTLQQMGFDPDSLQVKLKLKDTKARTALRTLLQQYNLGFAVVGETVLISTEEMVVHRQMKQRINVSVDKMELTEALKKIAGDTGANIVIDTRAAKNAKEPVSLDLDDVQFDTAVRLLAEMAGLRPVRVGNVLFITSRENAKDMKTDPELNPGVNPNDPNVPMIPGLPPGVVPPGIRGINFGGAGIGIGIAPNPAPALPPVVDPAVPPPPPGEKKEDK